MTEETMILDDKAVSRAIARISYEIIERNKGVDELVLVGIISRGLDLARRIAEKIRDVEGKEIPIYTLDITSFRDDIKQTKPSRETPYIDADNKRVVLVDDVLYTGRSVRAAIEAVMAQGRPKNIQLAVLVDRGHREIPIRPDFVGKNLPTSRMETVYVSLKERDGIDQVSLSSKESFNNAN